jgi:hypothetical protein
MSVAAAGRMITASACAVVVSTAATVRRSAIKFGSRLSSFERAPPIEAALLLRWKLGILELRAAQYPEWMPALLCAPAAPTRCGLNNPNGIGGS